MSGKKTPPKNAGMVSEEILLKNIKKLRKGDKKAEIPPFDVLVLFMIEQLHDMNGHLKRIADAFEGAKDVPKPQMNSTQPEQVQQSVVVQAPETIASPVPEPVTPQVEDIISEFSSIKDLVNIDTTSSAQFVLVYLSGYLGKGDFAKVGRVSKQLGGEYVSQGKKSHFKIPKMVKQTQLSQQEQTQSKQIQPKQGQLSSIDDIRTMFTRDLEALLIFESKGDYVSISPRQFLGSENFAKIASVVRESGGEYMSAGKDSHFRIPIK